MSSSGTKIGSQSKSGFRVELISDEGTDSAPSPYWVQYGHEAESGPLPKGADPGGGVGCDPISVGCRSSPLSLAQFHEFQSLTDLPLKPVHCLTHGDKDQKTSLRTLDKTDFFTREIDQMQLAGQCRLSVHSAKDLPDPLPEGLTLAALTRGLDPSDSLVFRQFEDLASLPPKARVGTSSLRRQQAVEALRDDLTYVDIRGNIGQRLELLHTGRVDALVIAECALIRLGLTHLPRIPLDSTTPRQGQLAILTRTDDHEMRLRLAPLDSRPLTRTLYFGLDPSHFQTDDFLFHAPLIQTQALPADLSPLAQASHILFTSKTTVQLLLDQLGPNKLKSKTLLSIGQVTTSHLQKHDLHPITATTETAEGLLEIIPPDAPHIAYPHSALARPTILDHLKDRPHTAIPLYTTKPHLPFPITLDNIDRLVFTSPSTVDAFKTLLGPLPTDKELIAQGPITRAALQ